MRTQCINLPFSLSCTACINTQEDEQKQRKSPQRAASVAEERQRDTNHRRHSEHHTDVYEYVEKEDAHHAVAIDSCKTELLSFCKFYKSQYQRQEEQQHDGTAHEALFLAYRTEYEVGILFRHEFQFRLCSVKETLSEEFLPSLSLSHSGERYILLLRGLLQVLRAR